MSISHMAFKFSSLATLFKSDLASVARPRSFVGVDMGSSAIKIVQLKLEKGVPTLETYGELQLGPYAGSEIGQTTHLPPHKMIEALIDILRESGATSATAAVAYSYNTSFNETITVPTLDPDKITSMMPIEAHKYVPVSLSKVTLSWVELGIDDEKEETRVLLSAKYNEAVGRYASILQGAGLDTHINEIEFFSTVRSTVVPEDATVAIIDMGASATRLYIVEQGMVNETHSVPVSGSELSRALEKGLSVNFLRAEEMKRASGLVEDAEEPRIAKILTQTLSRGMRELHTVTSRYENTNGRQVGKVILTGGGAQLRGMDAYVRDLFSRPVELGNPFAKVAYPAFLEDTLVQAGPTFSVAIGVALAALQDTK